VIDTAVTTVASGDIKAMFMTDNGDWGLQRKAKKLNRFVDGVFYRNHFKELGPDILTDSAILPSGIVHGRIHNNEIEWRRLLKPDVYVDYTDGSRGHPEMFFVKSLAHKDQIMHDYPGHDSAISASHVDTWDGEVFLDTVRVVEMTTVVEAWKLPISPNSPGRHIVAIDGTELFSEPWDHDWVPLAFMNWSRPKIGFWGQPLMDRLLPIQKRLNKLLEIFTDTLEIGTPKILKHTGTGIPNAHFDDTILSLLEWNGTIKPEFLAGAEVSPQVVEGIQMSKMQMEYVAGISESAAQGENPERLESAPAIRAYANLGTKRMSLPTKSYEEWTLKCAELTCELARAHDGDRIVVQSPGIRGYDTITSDDVKAVDSKSAILQAFPISAVPSTIEGRLDMASTMLQAGMAFGPLVKRVFSFPDTESEMSLENAPTDLALWALDKILDGADWSEVSPEPDWDLGLCLQLGKWTKDLSIVREAPPDVLQNLSDWLEVVGYWQNQAQQMALAQAGPPPLGPPLAKGLPQPTSPLLPAQGVPQPGPPQASPGGP